MNITRRKLIFGSVGAAALLPLSYVIRVSWGGYSYPRTYSHVTAKEAVIIAALAETIIGLENPFGISPESVDTVGAVNNFIQANSPLERGEIRILINAVEHVLPALGRHFKKFSELSVQERASLLESLNNSKRDIPKLIVRAVKTIVCFGYFNTPQVHEALGLKNWCGP